MTPLAAFASRLRAQTGRVVPDADPADGGTQARVLLLLERPGLAVGSGLVSRDNATPTAGNIRRFTEVAGLPRSWTLIWNVVPWLDQGADRNRAPRAGEIRAGLTWLPPLLDLLPSLAVVVLAGRTASNADGVVRSVRPDVAVMSMPHPSPTIVCTSPLIGERIVACLSAAGARARERSCVAGQLGRSATVGLAWTTLGVPNVGSG